MLEWYFQILRYSYRDQLSLPVIIKQFNLRMGMLPGKITESPLLQWPYPEKEFRLPRDFDDLRYYELYPSVRSSGMSARQHYFITAKGKKKFKYK